MANYTVPEAAAYLGSTVWLEIAFDDPECGSFHEWRCVQVVGVVLALPGVYDHPHFLGFDVFSPGQYPEEAFWSDIVSITSTKPTRHNPARSKRANGSSRRERAHVAPAPQAKPKKRGLWLRVAGIVRRIAVGR